MLSRFRKDALSRGPESTRQLGEKLARLLSPGDVLGLEGDLGCGKTVFVQGLARGLKVKRPRDVRSPTFALIHEYAGPRPLCHADLYRLDARQARALGLEEYWSVEPARWVTAVEWADRAEGIFPRTDRFLRVQFESLAPEERRITISGPRTREELFKRWH